MNFQKINNIGGWTVFAVALVTYWLTMEETASYWDCGEFISVSYKLEVPHPPGAPLFLLIGRLFSFLALGDVTRVAYWINFSSVLASAFTILFLFWSITLFGRKLLKVPVSEPIPTDKAWLLFGSGLVGALAYTFCDSFWFSAVEAEVYAMSSFFTAFVVWAMMKWDLIEDESKANRWLILIFYMMGLSIGVHLLNLVTIPALGLIYYFKKYKQATFWGVVWTLLISLAIIFFINNIIIPGLPTVAGAFEIYFVNSLRLPFGSGVIVFSAIVIAALVYGIIRSQKKGNVLLNTFLISTAFILIGYSSYAVIVIRSNENPPINENDPSDVMSFVRYLKREQYGSRPLLYGQYFTAQVEGYTDGVPIYTKGETRYEITDRRVEYRYNPADMTILPRIYSTQPDHQQTYRAILGLREGEQPTFGDNLRFMFKHQIGFMYMRYFMFNFAGRESDIQDASWLSPRGWFEELPEELARNKGRNNYFMIPLLLGLLGLVYQANNDPKNFAVTGLLFILTGVALVIYLNSPPSEPRERDYIYAGSYYAFCFWIGFSVLAIAELLRRFIKNGKTVAIASTLVCLSAPAIMAAEGWDDHDRSGRYFSVDSAINYLQSCAKNAVLFTGGDNDTFPLWYAQEVEGIRTDMRVVVLSYYNTDWYIKQTMRQTYESEPFPYTLTAKHYQQGGPNDYLMYYDAGLSSIDLVEYLDLIKRNYTGLQHPYMSSANMLPAKELVLNVDVDKVRALGIVPKTLDSLIVPQMRLRVIGNSLEKKDLAMLDLLATSNWERPIYVNNTSLAQFKVDLRPYVVQEGNAYRILPVRNPRPQQELVNTEVAYENMLTKFQYRGLDDPSVYNSEDYRKFVLNQRNSLINLANALLEENQEEKAREVILFSLEKIPDHGVPFDRFTSLPTIQLLLELGEKELALSITELTARRSTEMLDYYIRRNEMHSDVRLNLAVLGELQRIMYEYGEEDLATRIEADYVKYAGLLGTPVRPGNM
ncbi:MAG TPA: DUF2723 domain-containing protein [Cyclobacteriaceae bacterium]|nr:DUF2723 domain-containing protein [Cyclobacteriaceae bacterium]